MSGCCGWRQRGLRGIKFVHRCGPDGPCRVAWFCIAVMLFIVGLGLFLYLILDKGYCNVAGECYITVASEGKDVDQSWINQRACYGGDYTYFRMPESFKKADAVANWDKTSAEVRSAWITTCLAESNGCGSTKCHFDGILQWEYRWIMAAVVFLWFLTGIACLGCVPVTTCFAKEEFTEEGRLSSYYRGNYDEDVKVKEVELQSHWDRGDGLKELPSVVTVDVDEYQKEAEIAQVLGHANAPMQSESKGNGDRLCGCVSSC